ncbi:MAG: hypothetical protein N2556_08840 [Anaerolineae bacterium]|nr:hypothetical protein [Anaerolineae bacterium]
MANNSLPAPRPRPTAHRSPLPANPSLLPATPFLLSAILLAALVLRAGGLDRWGLWYDEAYCWWVASRVPLREMLALSAQDVIPPLYFLFLRA